MFLSETSAVTGMESITTALNSALTTTSNDMSEFNSHIVYENILCNQ